MTRLNEKQQNKSIENPFFARTDVLDLACETGYIDYRNGYPPHYTRVFYFDDTNCSTLEDIIALYKALNSENDNGIIYSYTIRNYADTFLVPLIEIFANGYVIKKCSNCEKYFIPYNRSDTIYCDRISPQDKAKTCKEYGAIKAYQDNLKNDKCMGLYRKIYMQRQMLAKRNPDIEAYRIDFENFKAQSKQWKLDVKSGAKTEGEYYSWLKSVRRKDDDD